MSPDRRLGLLVMAALAVGACAAPAEQAAEADEEVYALLDERRAELFAQPTGFRVEPAAERLRTKLLIEPNSLEEAVSLVECLEIAAANSRDYQERKERLYRAALDLTLERWRFSNRLTLDGSVGVTGNGSDTDTATADANLRLDRLLGSGARIVADIGGSLFRAITTGDGWDALSDLSLSVTQPLLRGAAREVVLEPLTQSERDLVYEVRSYERFRRTFAVDVTNDYFGIILTLDSIANEEANIANLRYLQERNEALADAGKLSAIQLDQASQDLLSSEIRLNELYARFGQQLDGFKVRLGLPPEAALSLDPAEFDRLRGLDGSDLDALPVDSLDVIALARRLDYLNTAEAVEDAERRARIAADALRAGLDLTLGLGATSEEGRPLAFRDGSIPWSAGLNWDLPIDNLDDRNAYRSSLLSLQSALRAEESLRDAVVSDLRDDLRQAQSTRERYLVQLRAVELAQRRVRGATLNIEAGRAETRDLLEAQRSLLSAQNAASSALRDFGISRLRLYSDLELIEVGPDGIVILPPPAP
jgi:outer membrane protein TolC